MAMSLAIIIILLRAGLGIKKETLHKVGVPALKMSCIPGIFEGLSIMFVASYILGVSKFLGLYSGTNSNIVKNIFGIPVSILFGIA